MTTDSNACGTARRLAWESSEAAVLPVERGRAVAHIANCEQCRRFQTDMQQFRVAGSKLAAEVPDGAFVAQLRNAATVAPRRRLRSARLFAGLAAAAAVLVVVQSQLNGRKNSLTDTIVSSQGMLLSEPGIESGDASVVQAWINARMPQPVHVPRFENARLLGAAFVQLDSAKAAVMRFQVGANFITYTIAPARDDLAAQPALVATSADAAVVAWRDATLQHVWVGRISHQHLTTLARSCAEQAQMALRTHNRTSGAHAPRFTSTSMESST